MALSLDGIADFVLLTLENHKRETWVDISMPLQRYYFASRIINKKEKQEKGGVRLNWKLRVANQGTAKVTGLYAVDDTNRKNVMTEAKQGWSLQTVNYIYDVREDAYQQGPAQIIEMMKLNEQGLYNDFFGLMETLIWTAPSSSSEDPMPPCGFPFWIQKYASATPGFGGGDPSGFADGAGNIKTATYNNWKNYGGQYKLPTRDDLIRKVVKAVDFCRFEAVRPYAELGSNKPNWSFCTVYSVIEAFRELLEGNNDNLGNELAWGAMRSVLLYGIDVEWVPALDNAESEALDTSNPFYGINWSKFEWFFRAGQNMQKKPPFRAARQHNVYERHMDNSGNLACYDRRQGGFVFYVA